MSKNNQLIKYENNPIKRWFSNILNSVKNRFIPRKSLNSEIENVIKSEFYDRQEQEQVNKMLEDFKATIKDEIGFLNYIYYRQGFKMGANVIKDCLINND